MKKLYFIIFIFLSDICFCQSFTGYARFVPDGDTLILKSGKILRYIGIDSPEINYKKGKPQPFSFEAKNFNKSLVKGNKLKIIYGDVQKDHFGRYLSYVYLGNDQMVNKLILKEGLGWCYYHKDNSRFFHIFLDLQRDAIKNNKGLWKVIKKKNVKVLANKKSMRFHSFDCDYARHKNMKPLKIINAFYEGYAPSRRCIKNIFEYGD